MVTCCKQRDDSLISALPVRLCIENPHGLVSLWDILRFHAEKFVAMSGLLGKVEIMLMNSPIVMREPSIAELRNRLQHCIDLCVEFDLILSVKKLKELHGIMNPASVGWPEEQRRLFGECYSRIHDELEARLFIAAPPSRASFYEPAEPLFGSSVDDAFPSAAWDIAEAGRCFAVRRNTACVFHLMRTLEVGLRVFAAEFHVVADHTNWHNIIEGIEKAVRGMGNDPARQGDWKNQQEFYSQAASHFMMLKDAWRNFTAHARGKYTDEEAEVLVLHVRAFMQKLATRLHE
jgi:hypothetical protein